MLARSLENTKQPVLIYAAKAAVLSLGFSVAFTYGLGFLLPDIGSQTHDTSNPLVAAFSFVVFAPAAETMLMIPIFAFIRIGIRAPRLVAACSALLWAGFHSLAWPYWGLFVVFPFFVFSTAFLAWERISRLHAISVTFTVHFMHNIIPALVLLASTRENA